MIQGKTNLLDGKPKKMLHVAPERCLTLRFQKIPGLDYLSVDLKSRLAMEKMDITQIPLPDSVFDVIFCSHVLEHIPDDRKALRELCRVLKSGGWAILMLPFRRKETFEDPSVTDPERRKKLFGYADHVRDIGHDYIDRVREAGFTVTKFASEKLYDSPQMMRMGLIPDWLFYCTKQGG